MAFTILRSRQKYAQTNAALQCMHSLSLFLSPSATHFICYAQLYLIHKLARRYCAAGDRRGAQCAELSSLLELPASPPLPSPWNSRLMTSEARKRMPKILARYTREHVSDKVTGGISTERNRVKCVRKTCLPALYNAARETIIKLPHSLSFNTPVKSSR